MIPFRLVAPLAFAPLLLLGAPPRAADTVVLIVRHAEKAGESGDVPLSSAGEVRARALVDVARRAGVSAVITTQYQRTRATAAPIAESLGVTPEVLEARGAVPQHARAVADAIRGRHAGKTVLVVGHSNTVPPIATALGAPALPDICDEVYDQLYTVVVAADGSARLIVSRYGAPTPPGSSCTTMMR